MKRYAVIGAGPMGLMSAVALLDAGHTVDIYERDDRIGGMSAAFDFSGLPIERYYHFICKTDQPLFALLDRYGLSDKLRWVDTKMGYFYDGKLYRWGSPFALLAFPHLDFVDKLRYALHVIHTKRINDWTSLDKENAAKWIRRWIGDRAYNVMWKDSFRLKFFEYAEELSASWIGTRIKRIALSRRNLMHESLGYLEGGSATLLDAMSSDIVARGGRIFLSRGIERVERDDSMVTAVTAGGQRNCYNGVLSTMPIQYVPALAPELPAAFRNQVSAIKNIPVACVILKLKHAISDNFWMNISDKDIEIPGVIEYSNLNPGSDPSKKILYAPFYMPKTHPKWTKSNPELIEEVISYLSRLNPEFRRDWIIDAYCHRYEFAQTICPPGFQDMLPPMRTPLPGLFMADTAYYYPEDRSISESVQVGCSLAKAALAEDA